MRQSLLEVNDGRFDRVVDKGFGINKFIFLYIRVHLYAYA